MLPTKDKQYDIFLYPYMTNNSLSFANVREKLVEWLEEDLILTGGFIGLTVSFNQALEVQFKIGKPKRGVIIPAIYRVPIISEEEAKEIAQTYLESKQEELSGNLNLSDIELQNSDPMWYSFFSLSSEMLAKGYAPSGLYVCVDKVDGHIWEINEQSEYFSYMEEQERSIGLYS